MYIKLRELIFIASSFSGILSTTPGVILDNILNMPSKMERPCPQRAQSQGMSNKLEDRHQVTAVIISRVKAVGRDFIYLLWLVFR